MILCYLFSCYYLTTKRLFVGEPVWTPYNRDEIDEKKNESRLKYVAQFFEEDYVSKKRPREDAAAAAVSS